MQCSSLLGTAVQEVKEELVGLVCERESRRAELAYTTKEKVKRDIVTFVEVSH